MFVGCSQPLHGSCVEFLPQCDNVDINVDLVIREIGDGYNAIKNGGEMVG
jgi:hypothetical protein